MPNKSKISYTLAQLIAEHDALRLPTDTEWLSLAPLANETVGEQNANGVSDDPLSMQLKEHNSNLLQQTKE